MTMYLYAMREIIMESVRHNGTRYPHGFPPLPPSSLPSTSSRLSPVILVLFSGLLEPFVGHPVTRLWNIYKVNIY